MDGDLLLCDLRMRLQRRAAIRAAVWSALLAVPVVATPSPVLIWLPIDVALVALFVWRIVRAAAFLDRPQLIECVELLDSTRKLRVVMASRQRYTFAVPAYRRHVIAEALAQSAQLAPARVLRR